MYGKLNTSINHYFGGGVIMKGCIKSILLICIVHFSTYGGGFDEYSVENMRCLTTCSYIIGSLAAVSFIGYHLVEKNRLQRIHAYAKTIDTVFFKKFLTEIEPLGDMFRWGLAHKMLKLV